MWKEGKNAEEQPDKDGYMHDVIPAKLNVLYWILMIFIDMSLEAYWPE